MALDWRAPSPRLGFDLARALLLTVALPLAARRSLSTVTSSAASLMSPANGELAKLSDVVSEAAASFVTAFFAVTTLGTAMIRRGRLFALASSDFAAPDLVNVSPF